MTTTENAAEATPTAERAAAVPRDEAARARLYLDLWERHLTLTALEGEPRRAGPSPTR